MKNNTVQKIIWVFGISGSGKGTLLRKFRDKKLPKEVVESMKLNEDVEVIENSFSEKDRKTDRSKIMKEAEDIIDKGKSAIIKFQYSDYDNGIMKEIKDRFFNIEHHAIVLGFVNFRDAYNRWERLKEERINWSRTLTKNQFERATGRQSEIIKNIGFLNVRFFNTNTFDYKKIDTFNL